MGDTWPVLGSSEEPYLGKGIVGRKLALKGPHKQISELKREHYTEGKLSSNYPGS